MEPNRQDSYNNQNPSAVNYATPATQPNGQPYDSGNLASQGKNKKKLLLICVAVIVAGFLIGGGVLLAKKLATVTPEQYREASSAASEATSKLTKLNFEASGLFLKIDESETQFNSQLDKTRKAIAEYKTAHNELDKQKALKNKDVSKLYKPYKEKQSGYVSDVEKYVNSMSKLGPVLAKCTDTLGGTTSASAADQIIGRLESCATNIKAVTDLSDNDIKTYATVSHETISQHASLIKQLSGLGTRDFEKRNQLRKQLLDLNAVSSKKLEDIESTIEKRLSDKMPRDELRKVSDELFNKSLSSKK